MRRDGARRPRAGSQSGTRAASGLRPGSIRSPARSWLMTVRLMREVHAKRCRTPLSTPSAERFAPTGRRSGGGALTAKARPGVQRKNRREMSMRSRCATRACAQVARSAEAHQDCVWRAARRQRAARHVPYRTALFGAPSPSNQVRSGESLFDKSRTRLRRGNNESCLEQSSPTDSIPPLDGEGGARLRAPGGVPASPQAERSVGAR